VSSLLGIIESPRSALKLDPFRKWAISRYDEGKSFHPGDALVGVKLPDDFWLSVAPPQLVAY
jgi:hypothetical protein